MKPRKQDNQPFEPDVQISNDDYCTGTFAWEGAD